MISGSQELISECNQRLGILYETKHKWFLNEARKLTKNREESEDLVQELYEYLHTKCNPKIFYGDSYNIFYCNKFLHSRYMNKTKKINKTIIVDRIKDKPDEDIYDMDFDLRLEKAHNDVLSELNDLKRTKMWTSARIFELYWMSTDTLDETAKKIGISKSTTFIAVKKVRKYLKNTIDNPFKEEDER
jgi:DNA-directed RNA polymerase specialized sigma24 family protein